MIIIINLMKIGFSKYLIMINYMKLQMMWPWLFRKNKFPFKNHLPKFVIYYYNVSGSWKNYKRI